VSEVQAATNRNNMENQYQRDEVTRMRNNIADVRGKLGDLEGKVGRKYCKIECKYITFAECWSRETSARIDIPTRG
jgi:hypothetical protein